MQPLLLLLVCALLFTSGADSLAGNRVVAWGGNSSGKTNVPPTATNVMAVAAGSSHSLALACDGTVIGWGATIPSTPPAGLSNVVAIAAGLGQSLALRSDGTVVAWGAPRTAATTNVPAGLSNVVAISCGDDHNLALRSDGTLAGWGANYSGQTAIPAGLSNVVAIAAGNSGIFTIRGDGSVWGSHIPATVRTNYTNVVDGAIVANGGAQGAIVLADGTAVAWGYAAGALTNIPSVAAVGARSGFNQAGATWLVRRNGTLTGLGPQYLGQPEVYQNLSNVLAVAIGYDHHLAIVGDSLPIEGAPLSNADFGHNNFSAFHPTVRGLLYWLEYKSPMDQADWTALPPTPGDGTRKALVDRSAADPQRIYRVRARP